MIKIQVGTEVLLIQPNKQYKYQLTRAINFYVNDYDPGFFE